MAGTAAIWLAERLRKVSDGRAARADTLLIRLFERSRCCSCNGTISSTDNEDMRFFEARTVRRNGASFRCCNDLSWFICTSNCSRPEKVARPVRLQEG